MTFDDALIFHAPVRADHQLKLVFYCTKMCAIMNVKDYGAVYY